MGVFWGSEEFISFIDSKSDEWPYLWGPGRSQSVQVSGVSQPLSLLWSHNCLDNLGPAVYTRTNKNGLTSGLDWSVQSIEGLVCRVCSGLESLSSVGNWHFPQLSPLGLSICKGCLVIVTWELGEAIHRNIQIECRHCPHVPTQANCFWTLSN